MNFSSECYMYIFNGIVSLSVVLWCLCFSVFECIEMIIHSFGFFSLWGNGWQSIFFFLRGGKKVVLCGCFVKSRFAKTMSNCRKLLQVIGRLAYRSVSEIKFDFQISLLLSCVPSSTRRHTSLLILVHSVYPISSVMWFRKSHVPNISWFTQAVNWPMYISGTVHCFVLVTVGPTRPGLPCMDYCTYLPTHL